MTDITDEWRMPLKKPLKLRSGEEIAHLDLSEPTAGQMKECDKLTGYAWMTRLVSGVCGVPEGDIDRLPAAAVVQASDYLASFIDAVRPTRTAS